MFVREIVNEFTESYEKFMENYHDLEYQARWSGYSTTKRPKLTDGLISTYILFDELGLNSEFVVNDVDKFISEYGDLEILEDHYDNTYNYNGYLDRYVEFHYFELENDQVLVTLSVGLGLDPRSAYTKNVVMIFEDSYDFLETLSKQFQLLDFEYSIDGEKYYGTFDGGVLSEFGFLQLNSRTGETVYEGETMLATTDLEEIQDTVSEILELKNKKVNVDKINYFCYAF